MHEGRGASRLWYLWSRSLTGDRGEDGDTGEICKRAAKTLARAPLDEVARAWLRKTGLRGRKRTRRQSFREDGRYNTGERTAEAGKVRSWSRGGGVDRGG